MVLVCNKHFDRLFVIMTTMQINFLSIAESRLVHHIRNNLSLAQVNCKDLNIPCAFLLKFDIYFCIASSSNDLVLLTDYQFSCDKYL